MGVLIFWLSVGLIVYTYVGYPLLLALLARTKPEHRAFEARTPSVTLLIAAYNEAAVIAQKIENSLRLAYPASKLQVLVAADGSNEQTPDIVRSYADRGVELSYDPERRGKMAAINRAMPLARGEIVVFSDANNMYDTRVISELAAPFADPTVGAVTGAKLIVEDELSLGASEGLYWKYESFIKEQETRLSCCTAAAGEILAVRRELFVPPPERIINDDFYIAAHLIRRGYRVIYNPRAQSFEPVSASAQDEMRRRARIVAGRYQAILLAHKLMPFRRPLVAWQMISHKFLRPLVPFAMIGALLANLVMVVWPAQARGIFVPPYGGILLALQLMFYMFAWAGKMLPSGGRLGKLLYLPAFLVNSNLAALAGLYTHLTERDSHIWERVRRGKIS